MAAYLAGERPGASAKDPLFLVRYRTRGARVEVRRITAQRIWKIVKALGRRAGMPEIHPHAFRHGCGVELLRRSGGNLRAVQEHLRHADIQTTTVYTRLTHADLQKVVSTFDRTGSSKVILIPTRRDQNPNRLKNRAGGPNGIRTRE
jgi:site-specific recombinase XerD